MGIWVIIGLWVGLDMDGIGGDNKRITVMN